MSKQQLIREALTRALLDVFVRENLCDSELRIHGTVCVTADNASVFVTQLANRVDTKTGVMETLGHVEGDYSCGTQVLPVYHNMDNPCGLPIQYFYRGRNASEDRVEGKSHHGASGSAISKRYQQSTPSMFSRNKSNKKGGILSSLLSGHGKPQAPCSKINNDDTCTNSGGRSNIVLDFDLRNNSMSPTESAVNCYLVPGESVENYTSLLDSATSNNAVPIDLSSVQSHTMKATPKPYSIIAPDAPGIHCSAAPTNTAVKCVNSGHPHAINYTVQIPTAGDDLQGKSYWLSKSPNPVNDDGTETMKGRPVVVQPSEMGPPSSANVVVLNSTENDTCSNERNSETTNLVIDIPEEPASKRQRTQTNENVSDYTIDNKTHSDQVLPDQPSVVVPLDNSSNAIMTNKQEEKEKELQKQDHDKEDRETAESLLLIRSRSEQRQITQQVDSNSNSAQIDSNVRVTGEYHFNDTPKETVIKTIGSSTNTTVSPTTVSTLFGFHDYSNSAYPNSNYITAQHDNHERNSKVMASASTTDNDEALWLLQQKVEDDKEGNKVKSGIAGCSDWGRKGRTRFTAEQLAVLEAEYRNDPFLSVSADRRFELADRLELPEKSVQVWFQNQRRRRRTPNPHVYAQITYEEKPMICEQRVTKPRHMSA